MLRATLFEPSADGRVATVEALVQEHQAGVRGFIRAMGVEEAWVDDVAQETFLVAYRKLHEWDRQRDAGPWLRDGLEGEPSRLRDLRDNVRPTPKENRMRHTIALAIALLAGAGIVRAADKTYPDITHEELVSALEAKTVTVIDANGTDSYKEGHIPTALNFDEVKQNLAAKLPSDKSALIVAYCANEECPAYRAAAAAAEELGYTNVKHYAKGIMGWKHSGAKVETAK